MKQSKKRKKILIFPVKKNQLCPHARETAAAYTIVNISNLRVIISNGASSRMLPTVYPAIILQFSVPRFRNIAVGLDFFFSLHENKGVVLALGLGVLKLTMVSHGVRGLYAPAYTTTLAKEFLNENRYWRVRILSRRVHKVITKAYSALIQFLNSFHDAKRGRYFKRNRLEGKCKMAGGRSGTPNFKHGTVCWGS
jgi:hypothetical protein